jgi:hypothetical protein
MCLNVFVLFFRPHYNTYYLDTYKDACGLQEQLGWSESAVLPTYSVSALTRHGVHKFKFSPHHPPRRTTETDNLKLHQTPSPLDPRHCRGVRLFSSLPRPEAANYKYTPRVSPGLALGARCPGPRRGRSRSAISSTQSWNVISQQRTCSPEGVHRVHVWSTHVITRVSTQCHHDAAVECKLRVNQYKACTVSSGEASWLGTRLTCLAIITSCMLSAHTDPVPRF